MNLIWTRSLLLIAGVAIAIEAILITQHHKRSYDWKESLASLGVAIGHSISRSIFHAVNLGALGLVWQHRLFTVPLNTVWGVLLLFVGLEFFYYWFHRASHQIRWLWTTHAVHHSAEQFNLSTAYRLGWTGTLSGNFLFFLPLGWLGFHPVALTTTLSLSLLYQFWIHTEFIPPLGPLEWILNTPAHHQIHHASNPKYLDCNFGGVLIVWDRLFGTFKSVHPAHPPVYGLTHPIRSYNPFTIALHEWKLLFRDLLATQNWKRRFYLAFLPTNWHKKQSRSI